MGDEVVYMKRATLFWGLFLILGGISLLLKNVLHLSFNVPLVLIAQGLILLGIFLLTGSFQPGKINLADDDDHTVVFTQAHIAGGEKTTDYNIIFGSAVIELPPNPPAKISISVVFGEARVILPPNRAVRVHLSAAFGSANMPGGTVSGFGERELFMGVGEASYLEGAAVFSSLSVQPPIQSTQG